MTILFFRKLSRHSTHVLRNWNDRPLCIYSPLTNAYYPATSGLCHSTLATSTTISIHNLRGTRHHDAPFSHVGVPFITVLQVLKHSKEETKMRFT